MEESEGVIEAIKNTHRGFSIDRLIVDPFLNEDFQTFCDRLSIPGTIAERNRFVLKLQKSGKLKKAKVEATVRTEISWWQSDCFLDAVEIALSRTSKDYHATTEEIFCDPRLAKEYDSLVAKFSPGRSTLEYRWTAIKLRTNIQPGCRMPKNKILLHSNWFNNLQ